MSLEMRTIILDDGSRQAARLEPEYWSDLEKIIQHAGISEARFFSDLYRSKGDRKFPDVIRMWVIDYYRGKCHAKPHEKPLILNDEQQYFYSLSSGLLH